MSAAAARVGPQPALAGRGILIVRPAAQAGALARGVGELGGTAVILPVLDILPPGDTETLRQRLTNLPDYDTLVFVSPSAVEHAVPLYAARQADWSAGRRVAAVGQGTRRALRALGIDEVLAPESGAGGAALLALPAFLEPPPRRVLIARGEGGREELAQALRARGARVDYAECYRRAPAAIDPKPLVEDWRRGGIDAVVVTSVEMLDRLHALLGADGQAVLRATPLFTHHARIAEAARALGIRQVVEAEGDETGLIAALAIHFQGHA